MIVNVASTHRFHLLDLARELSRQGHDVRFYSYVPTRRCERYGLQAGESVSLLWLVWPFLALARLLPASQEIRIEWWRNLLLDWYVAHFMRPCDVCIALGSVYLETLEAARRRGAVAVLEWGSPHTSLSLRYARYRDASPRWLEALQQRILAQYDMADYIAIPTRRVRDGFVAHGVDGRKLMVVPYGVSLSQFGQRRSDGRYDLIMTGGWSRRKGCDLLARVAAQGGLTVLHVGPIIDVEFPAHDGWRHVDAVDQVTLGDYYAQAKVFVLASRSEGFGMVLAQALAVGLPVVCSSETGGSDLRDLLPERSRQWVVVFDRLDEPSLHSAIDRALLMRQRLSDDDYRHLADDVACLSWERYGRAYDAHLRRIVATRTAPGVGVPPEP